MAAVNEARPLGLLLAATIEAALEAILAVLALEAPIAVPMLLMFFEIPPMLELTANCRELTEAELPAIELPLLMIAAVFEAIATDLTTCYIEFALMLIMFDETLAVRLPIAVD